MNESLVAVEAVTKRYGTVIAVNNVSLELKRGEVYSLVGANGAGKSTLMRLIMGLTMPDSGRVLICGEDLAGRNPATKKHLGYLPEELTLYERLTGREYLQLVAGLKEADPNQIESELEFFELTAFQNRWTGGYSQGMRKKLGLAAAVLGQPDTLVLDEPLNGLDVEMMRKVRRRIADERSAGRAVLVSSHVMDFVERISDRVGVMNAGRIVVEGAAKNLREQSGLLNDSFEEVFFHFAQK